MNETVIYEPFRTVPLAELRDELRFEFPDLPNQLFDHYILKAADTMARRGKIIRRCAVIHGQSCITRYALHAPDGMAICGVLSIRSVPCGGCYTYEVAKSFVAPLGAKNCGREIAWYDDKEATLHVNPAYCTNRYYVSLAVTPGRNACELPAEFADEFLDVLTEGARAFILMIPGRPWTDIQLGQAYYKDFYDQIADRGIEVSTHKQRGAVKMDFGRVM